MSRKRDVLPEFREDDIGSISKTLRTLKSAYETLTGQRPGQGRAPQVFVQIKEPLARGGVELDVGDLWINPTTHAIRYWTGTLWQAAA
jgi:hypothetical protein